MTNKLRAILKILTSEYYVLITPAGSITACLPRNINNFIKLDEFVKNFQDKG